MIPTARQHVPRAEFKDNLVRIVALVREAWPDVVVVLITPPPVDVDKWDGTKGHLTKGQRSLKNAEDYAAATREAAATAGCSCLDLFARIKAYEGGDSVGAVAVAGAGGWGKAWKTCLVDGAPWPSTTRARSTCTRARAGARGRTGAGGPCGVLSKSWGAEGAGLHLAGTGNRILFLMLLDVLSPDPSCPQT